MGMIDNSIIVEGKAFFLNALFVYKAAVGLFQKVLT